MNVQHEWRTVNGVRLHCAVAGAGPLLVLLHGFPEFWYSWRYQIPVLAEHFTVVAPDMRGYNESDKPGRVKDYSVSELVQDVVELIRSFGVDRAIVAGHDWGAIVAWQTAIMHPEIVEKLIILNVPHPRIFVQHLLTNQRQRMRSLYVAFFQLPWLPEAVIKAGGFQFVERTFRGMAVHKERFSDDDLRQYLDALMKPHALTSAINYYRAAARYPSTSSMQNAIIHVPTLVIWGEQDMALGKELNDGLERYVSTLELLFIEDASHWVQQDRPDLVNNYLLTFLLG